MKNILFLLVMMLHSTLACAALPTRFDNDVIFGATASPKLTGQSLGDTSHRWNVWANQINGAAVLSSTRSISTTFPLQGGGDLTADRTLTCAVASGLQAGCLSSTDWSTFNNKEPAITVGTVNDYYRGDKTFQVLNTTAVPEGTNLYYTAARFNTAFSGKSTTDLAEGTNLYYTTSRFDTAFSGKSTTDLAEGTNLYYTTSRANSDFDTRLATKSTTDLAEGSNLYYTLTRFNTAFSGKSTTDLAEGTNLYFTDSRARTAAVADAITDGVTNIAPSQNAVFDALALKANDADVVKLAGAQTVTGSKTFDDAFTMTQIATPSNPASGKNKLYFKSDDKLYKKTSAGVETEVGGGGGGSFSPSEVFVSDCSGWGSTNTYNPRFANTNTNVGSDITYSDSATDGATFTINTTGVYEISYNHYKYTTDSVGYIGISVNASGTTPIGALSYASGWRGSTYDSASGDGGLSFSTALNLTSGDVIRPHTSVQFSAGLDTDQTTNFRITRVQ